MCLFRKAQLARLLTLNEDQAIESYRGFDVNYGGLLCSPYRSNIWRVLRAMTDCNGSEDSISTGFHSFSDPKSLTEHDGTIVTRVKIWGKVYEYTARHAMNEVFSTPRGYLSQYLQIVEVVGVSAWVVGVSKPTAWESSEYQKSCLREVQVQYAHTELEFSQEMKDEYEFLSS